ncbi:hypothetical protein [Roseisolibacter agri]|uniref:Uncharacterized protein n=1 Tax=Roseisolibacter agri TaxID=2014610 RepID=A0AA37Q5V9_9BACT|nr:hypothetical protein [Roseisolibacter agri]GLC24317.1 hypothetical protein rosag_08300 [Roseisolibacter agri]
MSDSGGSPARLVVVGAGAASLKSTVALNVAVAAATAGIATRLRDLDGASSRALARAAGDGATVALPWAAAPLHVGTPPDPEPADAPALVVVDPPPRLDDAVRAELARAAVVLVPVDASPLARRALREVAAWRAGQSSPPALRVALARALPRDADRWALLEEIEALAPDALLPATLPAGRLAAPSGRERVARLYAPGTRGAGAYAALVGALTGALGLTSTRTTP